MVKVMVISGNIGVGKTSTMNEMSESLKKKGYKVYKYEEPLEEWKVYLDRFYREPNNAKYCFEIQVACFYHFSRVTTEIEEMKKSYKKEDKVVVLVERSPIETVEIFVENLKQGLLKQDYKLLCQLSQKYVDNKVWKDAIYLLLQCKRKTMQERIKKRNRSNERNNAIPTSYLKKLDELYEQLVEKHKKKYKFCLYSTQDASIKEISDLIISNNFF